MSHVPPTETPNVVIENPRVRSVAYKLFGWLSLIVAVTVVVDLATPSLDLSLWTTPILAGLSILGTGIGYTAARNTPKL